MAGSISLDKQIIIGTNRHGFTFAVGRAGERWIGYAFSGSDGVGFDGVCEDGQKGMRDRDEAIRRTSACACDPLYGYGVDKWMIPEELRGNPEDYRCGVCREVCCGEDHGSDTIGLSIYPSRGKSTPGL